MDIVRIKCPCCSTGSLDSLLLSRLLELERIVGFPIVVTSGYRCVSHNASPKVGGAPNSAHCGDKAGKGYAADIAYANGNQLFFLLKAIPGLFGRFFLYKGKSIVHVDIGDVKNDKIWSKNYAGVR